MHQSKVLPTTNNVGSPSYEMTISRASLEGLPVELQVIILQLLPDIASLNVLIQAVPSYRSSFASHRSPVVLSIMERTIGTDACPDALTFATGMCLWGLCLLPFFRGV